MLLVLTGLIYYTTQINQLQSPDLSFWLIEQKTKMGVDLWIPSLILAIFTYAISKRGTMGSTLEAPPTAPTRSKPMIPKQPQDDVEIPQNWKEELVQEAKRLSLPISTSIELDPFHGVPIGLRLYRSTPETSRRSIEEFALVLNTVPTPPRVFIKCVDIIEPGVPLKNFVKGALQKYLNCTQLTITTQPDGVNVTFAKPDKCWSEGTRLQP